MDECVFCKIVEGRIPSYKIYEDSFFLAFLDAFPTMKGQVLVIPKKHLSEYLFKMNEEDFLNLMKCSKKIALAMDKAFSSERTAMVVEGMLVPHVHVRLYPLVDANQLDMNSKISLSSEEMNEISERIRSFL